MYKVLQMRKFLCSRKKICCDISSVNSQESCVFVLGIYKLYIFLYNYRNKNSENETKLSCIFCMTLDTTDARFARTI